MELASPWSIAVGVTVIPFWWSWDMKMYFMILCFGFLIVLLWFLFLAWLIVVVYYNESVVVDVFDVVGMEIHGFLSLKLIVMHVLFVCRNTVFPFVFFVFVMCFIALLFWIESSAWDFWYLLIIYYIHQSYTYKHNATKTASVGDKIMFNNMQLLVFFWMMYWKENLRCCVVNVCFGWHVEVGVLISRGRMLWKLQVWVLTGLSLGGILILTTKTVVFLKFVEKNKRQIMCIFLGAHDCKKNKNALNQRCQVKLEWPILSYLVVSNMCYFHPEPWGNDPIWRYNIFQMGWFNHQLA